MALRAGGDYIVDPGRLVRDMRPSTLGLWMAMAVIDPWDENRADWRMAELAAATFNAAGATRQDGNDITARDFMRFEAAQQDPEEAERRRQRELAARLKAALLNASGHKAKP